MSDSNEQNTELNAQGADFVAGNAADIVAAIATTTDADLLQSALVAEKAGKERVTVVNALNAALNPPEPGIEYVDMVRDDPQFEGGPTTAQVHPDEVENYAAGDWKKA